MPALNTLIRSRKHPRGHDAGCLTPAQEAEFERRAEREFRGQRLLPNGRNFTCWEHEHQPRADRAYRQNFQQIKFASPPPGSQEWWAERERLAREAEAMKAAAAASTTAKESSR